MKQKQTVGIIGVGLIGGSLALSLRKNGYAEQFIGWDFNENELTVALERKILDEAAELETLCIKADIIIIAVPVTAIVDLLPKVLDKIPEKTIVFDVGSTKESICYAVADHPKRKQFVAAHPIAGTENSGPKNAIAHLFEGKLNILCDTSESSARAVNETRMLFECIGMKSVEMASKEHDLHLAYVSHLPHILSYILATTVLDREEDEQNILDLAGSGFESSVRLAKSSPEMWTSIFMENKSNILEALSRYIGNLEVIQSHLEKEDLKQTFSIIEKANDIRRVFDKSKKVLTPIN